MHLDLSHDEARLLKTALHARVTELRDELAHTDDREFRTSLRTDLDHLERLDRRIAALVDPADAVG